MGVYLSTRLGQEVLFALGLLWPVALGTIAWLAALIGFRKNDVI